MTNAPGNVAILGATGSIGRNTLEVIAASGGRLRAVALTVCSQLAEGIELAAKYGAKYLAAADAELAGRHDWSKLPSSVRRLIGPDALEEVASLPEVDVVVSAIVGQAGLRGTWAALEAGKRVALANKETLVIAGPLVMELAARRKAILLPIDSEHSAVFQALQSGKRSEVKRVILTASGGPFRRHTQEQLARVSVAEALAHPTWNMGRKISVDSATMMNKALEIIEARWLFDLAPEQIEVVIHPQSVVHSMVEFLDGSTIAQLGPPDMKLPIQYALTWPDRVPGVAPRMDWSQMHRLEFEPADPDRFPALALGHEVARRGGTAGAVLNAANEIAVARFLAGELPFHQIVAACRAVLEHHQYDSHPSLDDLLRQDTWARQETAQWICC